MFYNVKDSVDLDRIEYILIKYLPYDDDFQRKKRWRYFA